MHETLVAGGYRDAFEEFARPVQFTGRELHTPACPVSLVLSAVQEVFIGIARRLTFHGFAASGDFMKGQEVSDFLCNVEPGTGISLQRRGLWLGV